MRERLERLSFRRRLILLSTAAVALAIAAAAVATYVIVRAQLRAGVDTALRSFAGDVVTETPTTGTFVQPRRRPLPEGADPPGAAPGVIGPAPNGEPHVTIVLPSTPLGTHAGYARVVEAGGEVARPPGRRVEPGQTLFGDAAKLPEEAPRPPAAVGENPLHVKGFSPPARAAAAERRGGPALGRRRRRRRRSREPHSAS